MSSKFNFRKRSKHNAPEESCGYLLWRVSTTWRSSIEAALKPLQLTHPQFVILATLGWLTKEGERVTQASVGALAGLDPNTTSQVIRGLEEKNFIKRITCADPRAKNPMLTAEGQEVLAQALPAVENADDLFFGILSKHDSEKLIDSFRALIAE